MPQALEFLEIWLVSFGAYWQAGEGWRPTYLSAHEITSQRGIQRDYLALIALSAPPYPAGEHALIVGYGGEALAGCHIWLRWPLPRYLVDLQTEFRNLSNGQRKPCGDGLAGALVWFGLAASGVIGAARQPDHAGREIAALEQLFQAMRPGLDFPRAILRGRYLMALARIGVAGIPVDRSKLAAIQRHWRQITRDAGPAVADAKPSALAIGADGRHRAEFHPFASRTGRNQPSSTGFILASPKWLRRLIAPQPGYGLALIDWAQQEFGIAAALSGDGRMLADYSSGDPYLALAQRYYAGNADDVRADFKAASLGALYGIGAVTLAQRIGRDVCEARLLLQEHRSSYCKFWSWSDGIENEGFLRGRLQTVFGWGVVVNADANPRFLRNFPLQANGAEMLRLACCAAVERGITLCAPNHDALLIEAPLEDLPDTVAAAEAAMAEASEIVLDGFRLRTAVTTVRYPEAFPHPRSLPLWQAIDEVLAERGAGPPAHLRDASCSQEHPRTISYYVFNRKG